MSEQSLTVESTEKERVVQEIMNLAFLINQRTEMCVFIRFSGHVGGLDIDISESKNNYTRSICESDRYIKNSLESFSDMREVLLGILRDGEVDLNTLYYEVEEIKHYKF